MEVDYELLKKVEKARTRMALALPFIASSVMMLDLIEDNSVKTAETDGDYIYYNREFIVNLSIRQLMWLLAHEALHCVLLHHIRVGGRDLKLWVIACDYVINLILHGIQEFEFIDGCLLDFKFMNMAAEEVYNILNQLPQQQKDELKKQHKDIGGFRPPESGFTSNQDQKQRKDKKDGTCQTQATTVASEAAVSAVKPQIRSLVDQEEKWQIFAKQSMDIAKKIGGIGQGFGSVELQRLVEKIVNPVVPWYQMLYNFVDMTARENYDWNRPNTRYLSYGYYFPTLYSEELGFIVVAVDTSGSIRQSDLDRFAAEVEAIKYAYRCRIMVIYCDARIHRESIQIFDEDSNDIKLRPSGGGGTNYRPVFDYIENEDIEGDVRCLIYFTDGICNSYPNEPSYPVLWVGLREFYPPFGNFVLMEST